MPMGPELQSCAPGKLILSGEHSVVYGSPAVALAVNRFIRCKLTRQTGNRFSWSMPQTGWQGDLSWTELLKLVDHLDLRYQAYEQQQLAAGEILEAQEQLALYAFAQQIPAQFSSEGLHLEIHSDLPIGSGMGSSAALSAALTLIAQTLFSDASNVSTEALFQQVRYCERLCHGRGGLIDAATVTHGGLVEVQNGEVSGLDLQLGKGWFYINSGNPVVGTGECVARVRDSFADSDIWQQFTTVTETLLESLENQQDPAPAIRENHRLLTEIGVVPTRVQQFIASLEQQGGAAKISGAGAVEGDGGGAVIAYAPDLDIEQLCNRFNYQYMPIEKDDAGVRIID